MAKEHTYRAMLLMNTRDTEEFEKCLNHHLDYLIDFDNAGDLCTSAGETITYDIDTLNDIKKLEMLSAVLHDILGRNKPSDEDLSYDDNFIELYDNLNNVKASLHRIGLWDE